MPVISAVFWRKVISRLFFFLIFMMLLCIGVLKIIEHSPDQIQRAFESYFTQLSGYPTDIDRLEHVQFFPDIWFDMKGIRFWPIDDPDGRMISVDAARLRMPLWSVLIGMPRFSDVNIDNIVMAKELTGSQDLIIHSIAVDSGADTLNLQGKLGAHEISGALPLRRVSSEAGYYHAPEPPLRISGTIKGRRTGGHYFIDLNEEKYGATLAFERYRPSDVQDLLVFMEKLLKNKQGAAFPVQVDIQRLEGSPGYNGGPFVFDHISMDKDGLEPFRCLMNSKDKGGGETHPCARPQ